MMKDRIGKIWKSHHGESLSQGVIKTRIDSIKNLECYIGTISRTKAKFFTLLLSKNNEIHSNYLKRFAGVEIQILPYKGVRNELTIILLEDELTEIFILFIEDIINSLNSIENKEDALIIISRRVKYWQKLFSKYTNGLLSQQQRGLFGELNFIKQLIECGTNYEYVLKAWQAPMGSNQDFYFNNTAIEVKTSKSNTPSIKIANEYQLDITGFNKLFIVFYELIEFPNDENTLLKLINEIRMTLKDKEELLSDFNQKLDYLGISSNLESEYDKIGYVVRKENYYNVNKEFPKITFDSINEAISKVSYEVAPNKCTKFEIDFKEILKEIN